MKNTKLRKTRLRITFQNVGNVKNIIRKKIYPRDIMLLVEVGYLNAKNAIGLSLPGLRHLVENARNVENHYGIDFISYI